MRIRGRPADDLRRPPEAPSSSQTRPPPAAAAPPPSAPRAPAPCSETAASRPVQPTASEVDKTTRETASLDPRRSSHGRNRQEEEKEEGDRSPEDKKRGKEDGRSEHAHKRPAYVVGSYVTPAAIKPEEEEQSAEVEEKKSGDSRRVEEDEEKTATAAMCKKGDGKGWHCKRAAQCGYSLCQYHLDKLRSYACYSQTKKQKQKKKPKAASATEKSTAAGADHRQEAQQKENNKKRRRVEGDVLSTGLGIYSDSFYYYSGFGPRWGKRRGGGRSVDGVEMPDGGASQVQVRQDDAGGDAAATTVVAVAGGEDDDGYDCDASSRDGKPLKCRALSSLL